MAGGYTVRVWRGPETNYSDKRIAINTLKFDLDKQLDIDVRVESSGAAPLENTPYDSYRDYFEQFRKEEDILDGVVNILVYKYPITNAVSVGSMEYKDPEVSKENFNIIDPEGSQDDPPVAGWYDSNLSNNSPTMALVNADLLEYYLAGNAYFRNFVIHEALHPVLDSDNAPDNGSSNGHSFGEQISDGLMAMNSPMLTGYADPISNLFGNPRPSETCGSSSPPDISTGVIPAVSECTKREVERYVWEEL